MTQFELVKKIEKKISEHRTQISNLEREIEVIRSFTIEESRFSKDYRAVELGKWKESFDKNLDLQKKTVIKQIEKEIQDHNAMIHNIKKQFN